MADEKNNREVVLLQALEAAGTAVTAAARYGMQAIDQAPSPERGALAPQLVSSPPASPLDVRQWRDDENTRRQGENYYSHFKPGGAGNLDNKGANNQDLARLYAFLVTEKGSDGEYSFVLWMRWQSLIHDELDPLLAAPSELAAVEAKVSEINEWLHNEISRLDPTFKDANTNLSVAQYVVLSHAIVTQKEHKLLSPWGGTLEDPPKMFW
jgi:hypothetical protein